MSQFRHTANRTRELALAREIMQRQNGHRILLIEAASGYGKTHLLAQIRRDCEALLPKPMLISLDLKASEGGVESVFATIYSQLERRSEHLNLDVATIFAAYHAQTERQSAYYGSINININRNLIWANKM